MKAEITIEGEAELLKAFEKYGQKALAAVQTAKLKTALGVHAHAVRAIQAPGTGKLYRRGPGQNLSAEHTASAPDEAPATDTGRLVKSITWRKDGNDFLVGSTIRVPNYAFYLEFGTRDMGERPFLRPALAANLNQYRERLKKIHDEASAGL